ncbi:acetoin biosynthesis transcriptional regulator AlsR [Halalkalibacter krulwichiae]|uniref:HTH-type transcriptional regulator BenM n=1 Tax=Halalkalibacter krulwichiae TaxID=199441 RepID=A0A1X9MG62_9BACI|nr:LysR substrate-binding domain-containing protein [Halalkalibacter krulwichiae]ARK32438.1 HTH-type transcriptional regulator BenM [Halalkalibacter krulwichiae]
MELRHLKYFVTVAEELHFGRAAIRLNMAQPPLSLQIRQLEEEIGVQLFHRTKRKVELTKEGQYFLEKTYRLLADLDENIETIQKMKRGEVGEIVIGFIATAAYDLVPTIIKLYLNEYPGIKVTLKQITSAEQIIALQNGSIDVGVLSEPAESDQISFQIIREEEMVIALPKEHPLVRQTDAIQLSDLASEPFIITSRQANQGHFDSVINCCFQAGFSPNIIQETAEMSTVISLVAAGIGIALVPSSMKMLLQNEVVYRNVENNKFQSVTALAWKQDSPSEIVHTFIELVKERVVPIYE